MHPNFSQVCQRTSDFFGPPVWAIAIVLCPPVIEYSVEAQKAAMQVLEGAIAGSEQDAAAFNAWLVRCWPVLWSEDDPESPLNNTLALVKFINAITSQLVLRLCYRYIASNAEQRKEILIRSFELQKQGVDE